MRLIDSPDALKADEAAHLGSCNRCRQEYELFRRINASLRAVEAPPAPAYFAVGVMARIEADRKARRDWGKLLGAWKQLAVAVATVLLIAGSVFGVMRSGGPQVPMATSNQPPKTVAPAAPQRETAVPQPPVITPGSPADIATTKTPPGAVSSPSKTMRKPTAVASTSIPAPEETPKRVTAVAATRPVREFLSQQRIVYSTVLRVQVKNLAAAKEEAIAAARSWGAGGGACVASTSDGQSRIEVFRFLIIPEKAEGFISTLSSLGTVLARQDERSDITNAFNETKAEYESMIASRNAAPDESKAKLDLEINAMEEWLIQWEAATGNRTVTLCLVQ